MFLTPPSPPIVERLIATSEPIILVGKDREELDIAHERAKVDHYIDVFTGLIEGIERDKIF